jgi:membrane fusion protein, multidrug efflux system
VLVFVLLVGWVLYHHHQQQLLAQTQGAGAGRGGRSGGGGGMGGGSGGRGGGRGGGGANGPVAVTVATVASGDIAVRIPALGTITPLATVTVRTQVSGILQKIVFQEGQLVKAGDLLAQIDPRPFEAAVKQAEGNLKRDQALLADARLDLKRYEELVKQDSVAVQTLDTQRSLVDQYIGAIQADEGTLNSAQVNLAYTHIVSPVSGRVGLRQVDQGNYVTSGDADGIVVVTQLQPITAIFAVPEDNVPTIMQQLNSGNPLVAEAYDRTNSTHLADGKVLTADNQIDTTTGTIKLRALFDNKDGSLFANQFVNVQLVLKTLSDQTLMPNAAVHRGAPNGVVTTFVYLVNTADSTVSVRPVTLGVIDGEQVAVDKGLAAGDVVVTEGGDRLRDGAPVLLPAETPKHAMQPNNNRSHRGGGPNGQHRRRQQGGGDGSTPADAAPGAAQGSGAASDPNSPGGQRTPGASRQRRQQQQQQPGTGSGSGN